MDEFINGEFSGSNPYVISDGNLTDDYCGAFLTASTGSFRYSIFPFASSYQYPYNHANTSPRNGEILLYFTDTPYPTASFQSAKMSYTDKDGNNLAFTLQQLTTGDQIQWVNQSGLGLIKLTVAYRVDGPDYATFTFQPNSIEFDPLNNIFLDDNYLDYKFEATSSFNNFVVSSTGSTYYLTYGNGLWNVTTDNANGWNPTSEQYFFPLSPNTTIYTTASISMSIDAPVTFSWGIQAWQPSTNQIVDGIPSTVPIFNSANKLYLNAGQHDLFITSSTYQPIQGYAYEIDAYLEADHQSPNEYLIEYVDPTYTAQNATPPFPQFQFANPSFLPSTGSGNPSFTFYTYQLKTTNPNQVDKTKDSFTWQSFQGWGANRIYRSSLNPSNNRYGFNFYGSYLRGSASISQIPRLDNKSGGVFMFGPDLINEYCNVLNESGGPAGGPYPLSQGMNTTLANTVTASSALVFNTPPFQVGTTYSIAITIPSQSNWAYNSSISTLNNPGSYRTQPLQNWLFGPSSTALTCSTNPTDLDGSVIGYIPANTDGTFTFLYSCSNSSNRDLIIVNDPNASTYDGTYYYIPAISQITIDAIASVDVYSINWNMSQSNDPAISTSSFIFEPYFPSAFYNTDCDVLMNNYNENDFSGLVQSVNYENGGTIPSNLQQIISGTAEYAEVNDYLYRAHANTLPRYEGVRTTSPGFNLNSIDGYGTLPNVEQTTTYFAYFTSLKSNSPLYKGTTSPVLKYIIREDGETFNPATDEITYYDVIDSFPARAYANLLYDDTTTFSSTQSILLSGYSYTPIMYNINTSNELTATYTTTMSFNNLQGITSSIGTPASYSLYVQNSPRTRTLTANTPVNPFDVVTPPFGPFIDKPSLSWFNGGFQFNGTPTNYARSLFQIDYFLVNNTNTTQTGIFRSSLYKINGATTTLLAKYDSPVVISSTLLGGVLYTYNPNYDFIHDFIPNSSDYVYIEVELIADPGVTGAIRNWSWKIETLGIPIGSVFSPFWTTGSNNSLSITASKDLSDTLLGNYKQKDIITSGFPSIKFSNDIKIGDEFRFEYDENYVHKVTDIQTSGSQFVYILDRPIPNLSSLNINHFTVRRKIKDYITGLSLGSTLYNPVSEGFLLPEYPSVTIKNDFSAIIKDLAEKGLL
jgi:hypothetical protein